MLQLVGVAAGHTWAMVGCSESLGHELPGGGLCSSATLQLPLLLLSQLLPEPVLPFTWLLRRHSAAVHQHAAAGSRAAVPARLCTQCLPLVQLQHRVGLPWPALVRDVQRDDVGVLACLLHSALEEREDLWGQGAGACEQGGAGQQAKGVYGAVAWCSMAGSDRLSVGRDAGGGLAVKCCDAWWLHDWLDVLFGPDCPLRLSLRSHRGVLFIHYCSSILAF
jgi:hypothetical protein